MADSNDLRTPPPTQAARPKARYTQLRADFAAQESALESTERRYSLWRLLLFLAGAIALGNGLWSEQSLWIAAGTGALGAFALVVVLHLRVLKAQERAAIRKRVHERHLQRLDGGFREFAHTAGNPYGADHPYAFDIDLAGPGSLLQRIDVCHTKGGGARLAGYFSELATLSEIRQRQQAVQELSERETFRQELEARAIEGLKEQDKRPEVRLSGESFTQFAELPSLFHRFAALGPLIFSLPPITITVAILGSLGLTPSRLWLAPLTVQVLLTMVTQRYVSRAFNLGSARQHVVEAFERMLVVAEAEPFQAPLLQAVRARLRVRDRSPSYHMARLGRWVSLGELRQQFLLWAALNPLLLWDLHVLRGMERWNRDVGSHTSDWFSALSELEALSSLATLKALEPSACLPEVVAPEVVLQFTAMGHPLLSHTERVTNDLQLDGLGTARIITGSNMAGKSTLLRAVGLNIALGLAGGPVCAQRAQIPRLRLRAAMRAQDSLQEGASYFRAELNKLRGVVVDAESDPPVFFLLDELLRGTNERARHLGAKAVVMHLLARRACGLVATHDVALAALEQEDPTRISNQHFTDVMRNGEMIFDYRLRPGIVRTSNALRLLSMAGIDVPEEAQQTLEGGSV